MRYIAVIYLLFLVAYDHWSTDAVAWQSVYFAVQYGFAAAVFFVEARRGRAADFFLVLFLIFTFLSMNELSWITSPKSEYLAAHSGPPAFALAVVVVVLFLFLIFPIKNLKLWKKGKKSAC